MGGPVLPERSALVTVTQPRDVVGHGVLGVVGGLVAGVLAEPADVQAYPLAGPAGFWPSGSSIRASGTSLFTAAATSRLVSTVPEAML